MSVGSNRPRHEALLAEAERLLFERCCGQALTMFDWADAAGADKDRCSAGAWMTHMLLGQYEQAWFKSDDIRSRSAHDPNRFWHGESLGGKRVMLRCLHGYGDTVMYLRWLPLLQQIASEVTVQAAPEILPLLACFPDADRIVTWNAPGETDEHLWDVQVECAELPYLFRATPATLPSPTRIVFPDETLHRIRMRLGPRTRPRVGLVWSGSDFDPARSLSFSLLRQMLLHRHDVEFWSLQPSSTNGDWTAFCMQRGWSARTFYECSDAAEPQHAGMADMAAFASELDLVLTIDTLAAHVAGSLGVPTWLLLKHDADWRWIVDRDDTPWYPGMMLFRQTTPGDWAGVLTRLCDRLRDWNEEIHA